MLRLCVCYLTLRCVALCYVMLCYVTLRYFTLHYITLHTLSKLAETGLPTDNLSCKKHLKAMKE